MSDINTQRASRAGAAISPVSTTQPASAMTQQLVNSGMSRLTLQPVQYPMYASNTMSQPYYVGVHRPISMT